MKPSVMDKNHHPSHALEAFACKELYHRYQREIEGDVLVQLELRRVAEMS